MMKFTTEIKPARSLGAALSYPTDNCIGISLVLKEKGKGNNADSYLMKFWFSQEVCKKAKIHLQGKFIYSISDCSNGMQITFNGNPDAEYKGFRLTPTGTSMKNDEIKKLGKVPMACTASTRLAGDALDFKRTQTFERRFVDVIEIDGNNMILDIAGLPIYTDKKESKQKAKPSALKKTL